MTTNGMMATEPVRSPDLCSGQSERGNGIDASHSGRSAVAEMIPYRSLRTRKRRTRDVRTIDRRRFSYRLKVIGEVVQRHRFADPWLSNRLGELDWAPNREGI